MSEPEALFDIPRSRFTKEPAEIERMLQWHAQITTELQRRVLEAAQYVRSHNGDPKLLDILEGSHRPEQVDQLTKERLT
ncbi:hypothetical protein J2D78_01550 [Microbacterium maritypicum]|uniref:hypothetical protein n=1 Tax=Microbacterium maritypicum TaxID=33918 RepID=UPI001B33BE66|nr:hypothetical protein [Microbacterium liquefaciens]MBP5800759.1 hypothetical protein [Microbacterium liquefaciens]